MSLVSELQGIAAEVVLDVQGEPVTLYDAAGDISAEIPLALVSIDAPRPGIGDGPVEYTGVIRIPEAELTAGRGALTADAKGARWNVLSVGQPLGGFVRMEIAREETDHTNRFDLNSRQASWGTS